MKYRNPYYKKTKRAFDMLVSCAYCKANICKYRKVGKGNLVRLWLSRIVEMEFEITKDLACPFCGEVLGSLVEIDGDGAYKILRSSLQTRRLD